MSPFVSDSHGAAPPPAQRYWRGPVLHDFDGYTWRRTRGFFRSGAVETRGPEYDYSLMLEPTDNYWVFALDMPVHWDERPDQPRATTTSSSRRTGSRSP